jgi:hypothetical protein
MLVSLIISFNYSCAISPISSKPNVKGDLTKAKSLFDVSGKYHDIFPFQQSKYNFISEIKLLFKHVPLTLSSKRAVRFRNMVSIISALTIIIPRHLKIFSFSYKSMMNELCPCREIFSWSNKTNMSDKYAVSSLSHLGRNFKFLYYSLGENNANSSDKSYTYFNTLTFDKHLTSVWINSWFGVHFKAHHGEIELKALDFINYIAWMTRDIISFKANGKVFASQIPSMDHKMWANGIWSNSLYLRLKSAYETQHGRGSGCTNFIYVFALDIAFFTKGSHLFKHLSCTRNFQRFVKQKLSFHSNEKLIYIRDICWLV